jgi:hypothetical protein
MNIYKKSNYLPSPSSPTTLLAAAKRVVGEEGEGR